MKRNKLSSKAEPPCPKCPYKLGIIHTVANPCPKCMLDGYQTYEWFMKQQTAKRLETRQCREERKL